MTAIPASLTEPRPSLLDLPSNVLSMVLSQCPFGTQLSAWQTSRGLRAAVDEAWATAAAARRGGADRFCREGLPLAGELRQHEDSPLTMPVRQRQVLAAYDRASPPPPGPEGPLHAWYRRAADLLARRDALLAADGGTRLIGALVLHVGEVNTDGLADGFGAARLDCGRGSYYIGEWRGGRRHGFGLMFVDGPVRAAYHGYFADDAPTHVGELTLASPAGFSWAVAECDWRAAVRRVGDQTVDDPRDDGEVTEEWVAELNLDLDAIAQQRDPNLTSTSREVVPY